MKWKKVVLIAEACAMAAVAAFLFNSCGSVSSGGHTKEEKPWSFIQISDLHAGMVLNGSSWTTTVNTILASNKAWNLKLVVSPGDLYEQDTNHSVFKADSD